MKFPKYWKRVENACGTLAARGWSDQSQQEADQNAENRLKRIENALRSDAELQRYHYCVDDVILEEVVERLPFEGREQAVVTRNSYGSLVINASGVLFIDIDVPEPKVGLFKALFGKRPSPDEHFAEHLEGIRQWQSQNRQYSLKVYRTRSGYRAVVTNCVFHDQFDEAIEILEQLRSDPLYRALSRKQKCFRARLTPKPWRVGAAKPPGGFPFDSDADEQRFRQWQEAYGSKSAGYGVCKPVEQIGSPTMHPEVEFVLGVHDHITCKDAASELA